MLLLSNRPRALTVFLSTMALFLGLASTAQGVEALQLEHVPIDASLGCKRVFFKSSQNFQGTIYVLPVVIPDTDEYGDAILTSDVSPQHRGDYLLNFQLYFPNDDQAMKSKTHVSDVASVPTCNFEAVKHWLNSTRSEADQISTIAYMPLTSIEVSIPDFVEKPFFVGRKETDQEADLIAYQGITLNVVLPMTNFEKAGVLDALTRQEGLQARVRMRFRAHRQNGAMSVRIDMTQLATNFNAAASGEKYLVQADLEAKLRAAMAATSIQIDTQESTSDAFNNLAKQILDKVMSESRILPDLSGDCADAKTEKPPAGTFSVKAVLCVMASKINSEFTVRNSTAEEVATAEVVVPLQGTLSDPNIRVMRVASGESLEPTLSEAIYEGETFTITGAFTSLQRIEYREKVTYINAGDLRSNYVEQEGIGDLMTNGSFNIVNEERNGVLLAVGRWEWWHFMWTTSYVWKRVERIPVITRNPKVRLDNDRASYSRFPVYATFSQLGGQRKMYSFEDLMNPDSPHFEGRYDESTGSIVVKAKKTLGLMALRPRFFLNENNDARDFNPDLRETCKGLTEQAKMNCYFPQCKDMKDDERADCLAVDFRRIGVNIEEVVQETESLFGYDPMRDPQEKYVIRYSNRATARQRVIYYHVTLPRSTVYGPELPQ